MAKTYETEQVQEKFLLAAVDLEDGTDVSYSLDELAELTETAGGIVVGRLIQKRESVHPGTYVGKGKIEELRELIMQADADGIVCDDELTPAQLTNLQEELQVKVLDRTVMILDISSSTPPSQSFFAEKPFILSTISFAIDKINLVSYPADISDAMRFL